LLGIYIFTLLGWLEPLLDRIALNSSTVTSPVLDWIVDSTFEYKFQGTEGTNVGGFNWNLDIVWEYISHRKRAQRNFQDDLPVRYDYKIPMLLNNEFKLSNSHIKAFEIYLIRNYKVLFSKLSLSN